jgi:hypothetical protein
LSPISFDDEINFDGKNKAREKALEASADDSIF